MLEIVGVEVNPVVSAVRVWPYSVVPVMVAVPVKVARVTVMVKSCV